MNLMNTTGQSSIRNLFYILSGKMSQDFTFIANTINKLISDLVNQLIKGL